MGIEINPFAAELARVSVWIGEIQWMREKGFDGSRKSDPEIAGHDRVPRCVAEPGRNGRPNGPKPTSSSATRRSWAGKMVDCETSASRRRLGDVRAFDGPGVPREKADLVCYLVSRRPSEAIDTAERTDRSQACRTNSIRGGANREVSETHPSLTASIFEAWDDEPWMQDGAAVRVSIA